MEGVGVVVNNNEEDEMIMELPPGFRFHPTDEEIITHYLTEKVINSGFSAKAIGEVDMNKCEPWDLPKRAKMGEKEWFFFCQRDRKYPTGMRTNRATESGYWKATGKDKEIFKGKGNGSCLVGMKKTLVFYKGRAPKGEKTNWVMHEYRLEGRFSYHNNFPKPAKDEWVVCRVFHKNNIINGGGGGGIRRGDLIVTPDSNFLDHILDSPSQLPPLMDLQQPTSCSNDRPAADDDDGLGIGNGMGLLNYSSSRLQLLQEETGNFNHLLIPNVNAAFKNSYQDMISSSSNSHNPWLQQQNSSNLLYYSQNQNQLSAAVTNLGRSIMENNYRIGSSSLSEEDQEFNKIKPAVLLDRDKNQHPHDYHPKQHQQYCKVEQFSSNNSMVVSPSQETAAGYNDMNTEISSSLIKIRSNNPKSFEDDLGNNDNNNNEGLISTTTTTSAAVGHSISDLDSLWDYRDY